MIIIPNSWKTVLSAIQKAGYYEAFIGGGALRDLDNGAPIKDVDIFVRPIPGAYTFRRLSKALHWLSGTDVTQSAEYEHRDISGVFEFVGDAHPLNIIEFQHFGDNFMQDQLDRFDIGLCRIAFNGEKLEVTSPYCLAKAEKKIVILNPWDLPRSIKRARRIAHKYPGWTIHYDGQEIPLEENPSEDFLGFV